LHSLVSNMAKLQQPSRSGQGETNECEVCNG
jgi:hypothetical protein